MTGLSDVSHRALLAGSGRVLANRRTLTLAIGSALLVAFGHAIGAEGPLPPWCPPYPTPEDPIECRPTNPPPPLPNVVRYTDNQFVPTSSGAQIPYDANKNVTLPDNDPVVLDGRAVALAGATGTGSRISNLADGVDGMDAVNRRQLDGVQSIATNAQNTANTAINTASTAINTANTARTEVSNLDALAVKYTSTAKTQVTLGGAKLSNIADGTAATDAVNRRQLDSVSATATNAQTTANNAYTTVNQLAGNALQFDGLTFNALRSGAPTRISGVADGVSPFDAVNRRQLDAALAGVTPGTIDALNYDSGLGAYNANREGNTRITGVADGIQTDDAVNLGQLNDVQSIAIDARTTANNAYDTVNQLSGNALQFDGTTYNASREGSATRISGVAAGVEDNDAANVGQLNNVQSIATDARTTANNAFTTVNQLAGNALQFDGLTFNALRGGAPTRISGVANGIAPHDAVNRSQLDAAIAGVTPGAIDALRFDAETGAYNARRDGSDTRISGVADGEAETDAVNRRQLDTVRAEVQQLDGMAVKYTDRTRTTVMLGAQGTPVRVTNVADGVAETDAVNRRQLDAVRNDISQATSDALKFDGQSYNALRGGAATRITGLAAGVAGDHAVNFDQLSAVSAVFGGGARWSAGSFLAPTYTINGRSYSTVGDAFAAVDLQITNLNQRVSTIETTPRDPNPGSGSRSVDYDTDARDSVTLRGGANGTRVSNVAAGVEATDAANVAQVRQAEANSRTYTDTRTAETLRESRQYTDTRTAETLRESKQYTDTRFQEVLRGFDDFTAQVDRRLQQTDKRISRQSAMTSAMVQMGINAAGARTERGRVAVGMGVSDDGEAALSVGYSKTFGNRVSVSIGGAFSGGEASGGVGIGFDL